MLVLFVVFCFAPFSSSADDGGAERNVTGTVQAARKAVSSVIGDVEPAPVLGSGYDAHFFIRYDSSTQTEDGTTHYSPKHYFPVGTTASGYVYGSGGSDYTSVDGKVLTKSAYVPGAEAAITGGNVNLYDSFDTEALHTYFKTVYDNILQEPSRDVLQASIEKALGAKYAAMYAKGEIDVLWYVSKEESSYVNVDGVVYYVKSGQVVDKPETDSSTVEIDGIKNLKGRNFKKGDSWNFAIQADTDDAPMPEKTTARIQPEDDAVEYFTFGEIRFTRADLKGANSKTFRYTITESGSVTNVTNDSASHTVNVTVSYDRNKKKLSAKAEYLNGGKSGSSAEFNNEYHKPVTRIQVEKVWADSNDRSRMRPESITIHLLRNGEEIKTKTVTEADDWKWTFDNLDKFDANDKEYKYTIKEDTVPFYTSAESTDADGNTVITNTYKPEKLELKGDAALKVTKVVVGKKSAEPFTFKLTAAENYGDAVKMPANTEVKTSDRIPADGAETKSFQPVEITKAGTYKFKVKETTTTTAGGWNYDNRERTLTVKVADNNTQTQTFRVVMKDNGTGKLTVKSGTGKKLNFENEYKSEKATVNFEGLKVLEGRNLKADEFTFKVTSDDADAPMPKAREAQNRANGSVNFGTVTYGKDDLGDATEKTFTYKVTESGKQPGVRNDTETKIVKVTVKDDGKGHITAELDPKAAPLFTFNNTYSTTSRESSVTGQVSIKKALAGRAMEDGEFHFVLKDENGKTVGEGTNDKDGNISFPALTFKSVGTYNYTVEEVAGNDSHITYDATPYKVSAVVTDNLDGTLKVTWKSGTGAILFKNTYRVDPTNATPSVEKKITGGNPAKDSTFRFTLTGTGNAPMPKGSADGEKTETITGEGQTDFGKITFTRAGTYTYKVTEELGNEASYNYDSTEYTLTYKVTDVRGELKAEQSITAGGKSADSMVFTNEYAPASMEGDAAITGTKELVGRSMLDGETFDFALKAGDEATQKALDEKDIVLNDTNASLSGMKDGEKATFSFGRAEFSKEGEYTFTVTEKDGGKAGMTYDDNEKVLKVKVAKKNGVMTAVQEETPAFRNTYEAAGEYTPEGTKTLLSEKKNKLTIKAGEFKFSVYYAGHEDQKPVTTGVTTSGKDAAIHFGTLSYTVSDLEKLVAKGYADKAELDNGARYYIDYVVVENASENNALQANTQAPTFRVEVTDNGDGTLTAESEEGSKLAFENLYKSDKATVHFNGQKVLEGRPLKADEFTFNVTSDEENAPMPEKTEVKNEEGGNIDFGTITYGKDDLGDATEKTFTYQVKESGEQPGVANDTETKTVKVTVKDDGEGHITAETEPKEAPLFAFNNTYSTTSKESSVTDTVKIRKTLTGRKLKNKEFTFVLKDKDGKNVAEAKNNADGSVAFKNLTFDEVGTYNYIVKEVKGNAKRVSYDANAYNVTATVTDNLDGTLSVKWSTGTKKEIHFYNRYKKKTVTPNPSGKHGGKDDNNNIGPFTGDDSNADLYLGLMGASAAILAALAGSRKKRKL